MATYYAWSTFQGTDGKKIQPGAKVDAKVLGVSDEEFEQFVEAGSARPQPYPDMGNFDGSPREYYLSQVAEFTQGGSDFSLSALPVTPVEENPEKSNPDK